MDLDPRLIVAAVILAFAGIVYWDLSRKRGSVMHFEIYRDSAGEHRWRLVAANGKILGDSGEGYVNVEDCRKTIASIQAHVSNAVTVEK